MTDRIVMRPIEVQCIVKTRRGIRCLNLTDLGPVGYLTVGGKRISVLLGLQPNYRARKFIEQTARRDLENNIVAKDNMLWPDINKKGVVMNSGLNDAHIFGALKSIGLNVGLPNKVVAQKIVDEFRSILLNRGIEMFSTLDITYSADIHDRQLYKVYCGVSQNKLGIISNFSRDVSDKRSLILVA